MYIQESYYQKDEPAKFERDSRGTLIEPGLRVAYNHSGAISLGKIIEIKKNSWEMIQGRWRLKFEMHIENEETGSTSTVKNPNSFVII